jgi:hypothetical protein
VKIDLILLLLQYLKYQLNHLIRLFLNYGLMHLHLQLQRYLMYLKNQMFLKNHYLNLSHEYQQYL